MRVLISDKFSEKGLEILRRFDDIQVDYQPGVKGDELLKAIADADALIIRSGTKVTAELIDQAPKLKAVGRAGVGVDNVDLPAAGKRGIVVMNTPGGNTIATAEHTIAMMMAMSRRIPQADAALKDGRWEKSKNIGVEVYRKTLGVLGYGNVGRIVVNRALGLQMRVLVHDPFVTAEKIAESGAVPVEFDKLLTEADYISIHVPKSEKTLNLINAKTIAKMKDGVRLLNCARGGILNEADLAAALESGKVAAAALDVYATEPCTDSPLFAMPTVIGTPHLGASTSEAQNNVAIMVSEQIVDFLKNGIVKNAVNAPYVEPEMLERMRPAIDLARRMGDMLGQLLDEAAHTVKIFLGGDFTKMPAAPIRIAALTGLLSHLHSEGQVNVINAPYLAEAHGIEVVESKRPQLQDYVNVIGLKVVTKSGKRLVQGSIPAPGEARIVQLDDYRIALEPEGSMLLITNKDVPGVVGEVGTLLGKAKVNIGQLRLSRIKGEKHALMVVSVDCDVPSDVIESVRGLSKVISAELVRFNS